MEDPVKNNLNINMTANIIIENAQKNSLWGIIKKELGTDIPSYLKHLLHFFGFESAPALKNITDEIFTEMEEFAKKEMLNLLGNESYMKSDFFGIYCHKPEQFRILPGHKLAILEIKKLIEEKGMNYFSIKEYVAPKQVQSRPVHSQSRSVHSQKNTSNLNEEENLYMLLKNWYCRQPNGKIIFKSFLENPKNRYIQIFLQDSGNMPHYSAKILCCLCNIKMSAHKCKYGNPGSKVKKTRWVIQNFIKHVKEKHLNLITICCDNHKKNSDCNPISQTNSSEEDVFNESEIKIEPTKISGFFNDNQGDTCHDDTKYKIA